MLNFRPSFCRRRTIQLQCKVSTYTETTKDFEQLMHDEIKLCRNTRIEIAGSAVQCCVCNKCFQSFTSAIFKRSRVFKVKIQCIQAETHLKGDEGLKSTALNQCPQLGTTKVKNRGQISIENLFQYFSILFNTCQSISVFQC